MLDGVVLGRSVLVAVLLGGTAAAQPAPVPALDQLAAIGRRALPKPSNGFTSARGCAVVPTKAEAAATKKRVVAWIDQQFPDEHQAPESDMPGMELAFDAGCKHGRAMFVSVGQDRTTKPRGDRSTRRNFLLLVDGDHVEQLAERTSSPSTGWMEWADEGGYAVIADVDLDGDGAADLVWSEHEHEGGSSSSSDHLIVRFANGTTTSIVRVKDLTDARVVGGQLMIAGQPRYDAPAIYACVGKDLRVAPCAAAAALQRAADKLDAATQLTGLREAPDRELVVGWLAALGVKAPPGLLAALPPTTAQQRAERHVARFLAGKQLDDASQTVFEQRQPAASAYFDQLAAQLGDTACTPAPLTDAARARLLAWIAKQDDHAEGITLTAECGAYAWVEWDHRGDPDHRELLVALDGAEPVRVAKLKPDEIDGPRPIVTSHLYDGAFFQHGDLTVGFVIRGYNVSVIANDKVVAQSHGQITRYSYDRRWGEQSPDLLVDAGTIMHVTPTGFAKLDRAVVKPRETERAARERVVDDPPSGDPAYLAALRTLGADAKLVAECAALAPAAP